MTATLIALTLICLAALAGSARSGSSSTPLIQTLNGQVERIRNVRAAKCLSRPVFRWHPGYQVPAHMRLFVIGQRRARLEANRALPAMCSPVDIGRVMAAALGWTGYQWQALYQLWDAESGWSPWAVNSSSGACGIPQQHPCSLPLGQARPQIRWGLGYIAGRYGTPAGAWAFFNANDWY